MIGKIVYITERRKPPWVLKLIWIIMYYIQYTVWAGSGGRRKREKVIYFQSLCSWKETWIGIVSGIIVNENDFFSRKQQNIFYSRTLRLWLHIKYVYKRFADSHYSVSPIKLIWYTYNMQCIKYIIDISWIYHGYIDMVSIIHFWKYRAFSEDCHLMCLCFTIILKLNFVTLQVDRKYNFNIWWSKFEVNLHFYKSR